MIGLRRLQIVRRNGRPADPAEACDLCSTTLEPTGSYIDGKVMNAGGMWANMCMPCFLERGYGIGWGIGQLYGFDGLKWQCIAGGAPEPLDEED